MRRSRAQCDDVRVPLVSNTIVAGLLSSNSGRRHVILAATVLADSNASRYYSTVIRSFADRDAKRLWNREPVLRFPPELRRTMLRKLGIVDAALDLEDLRVPPGNRLEKLRGDRAGQYSIRVNNRWRICFEWLDGNAEDVEIVDYH